MSDNKLYSIEEALQSLGKEINQLTEEIKSRAAKSVELLATQAHAMIAERAQNQLKSSRHIYIENLGMANNGDNIWAVYLRKPAQWIEEGTSPRNMIDDLVKGPKAKTTKDGTKYAVIPFEHSKAPSQQSRSQLRIAQYATTELKRMGLDKPIMRNGKPVIGRAATVNLTGSGSPQSKQGKPLLSGLTIYQREQTSQSGKKSISRDVFTFRVASEKQKGSGLWDHPGNTALGAFDAVAKEIDKIWDQMITEIVRSI